MAAKDKDAKDSSRGVKCPRCNSLRTKKNGIVRGEQRFLCQRCQTNFHLFNNKNHPKFLKPLLEFIAHAQVRYSRKIEGTGDVMTPKRVVEVLEQMVWDDRDVLEQIAGGAREQDGRKNIADISYTEEQQQYYFTISFTGGYSIFLAVPKF
jgi:hypothetical protein